MENVFLEFFNMSITASWLVLAVIVFRFVFKKAPKSLRVIMWGLVALRLVCPLSLESVLSIIPSTEFVPPEIVHSNSSADLSGAEIFNAIGNNQVYYDLGIQDGSVIFTEYSAPDGNTVNPLLIITYIASILWVVCMAVMLLYTLISYLRILKKVREATPLKENIWICDNISTPFILGLVKPRIFLPSSMNEQDTEFVIAHEKAHLKRRDHLWKPLGFALLTVYWFNPVLWVAYVLLCRDIELACDEKVIKEMGTEIKKSYSDALINCSVPRKMISACPLAFGETGVKGRIKSVLNYKKPAFWVIVVAVVAVLVTTVCFMTNPDKDDKESTTTTTESTTLGEEDTTKGEESTTETTTEESTTEESTTKSDVPPKLSPLSTKKALQIKKDYLKKYSSDNRPRELVLDDVEIKKYYGTYNDCDVVLIDFVIFHDFEREVTIAGYKFIFSDYRETEVYRNGEFKSLKDAYSSDWLSKEDIKAIHYYHTNDAYIEDIYTPLVPISEVTVAVLKTRYLNFYNDLVEKAEKDLGRDITIADVTISDYFGVYGVERDCMAINIDCKYITSDANPTATKVKLANCTFNFSSSKTIDIYYNGEFITLEDAYKKGGLEDDDIKQLHYYYTTKSARKSIDNSYIPPTFVSLTDEKSLKIKQDYIEFNKEDVERYEKYENDWYAGLTPEEQKEIREKYNLPEEYVCKVTTDDVNIRSYYGTFNGCSIMFVDSVCNGGFLTWCESEIIAGYEFWYSSSQKLDVHRNGEFATLKQAYQKGWLTKKDIRDIYYYYNTSRYTIL